MVSQATKPREWTLPDIAKQSMFTDDRCGCLYRKIGERSGKLLNLCMNCKINAVLVVLGRRCVGDEFTFGLHDRVTPVAAGPVRTAAPQPTEPVVEKPKEEVVFAVVRFWIGIEKDVCLRRDIEDAKRDREELLAKDPVSSYLIESRLLT
jgi:hypothetical protein